MKTIFSTLKSRCKKKFHSFLQKGKQWANEQGEELYSEDDFNKYRFRYVNNFMRSGK